MCPEEVAPRDRLNSADDWRGRARREAAAIVAESDVIEPVDYSLLVSLVAIGWLQGVNYGSHEALHMAEEAFRDFKVEL